MNRDKSIDVAKGIGMILVIIGHITSNELLKDFIYLFHMPLFFILSGMTYFYSKSKMVKTKSKMIKKFKSIYIPYFFFSILCFIYWVIIERKLRNQMNISIFNNFINIFLAKIDLLNYAYNVAVWFLPCIFITEIIYFFIDKINKQYAKFGIIIIFLLIGFVLNFYHIILPVGIETALIGIFFMNLGHCYKKYKFSFKKVIKYFCIAICFGILIMFTYYRVEINLAEHIYDNYLLFIIASLSGSILVIEISKLISNNFKCVFLEIIGKNSLVILGIHEPLKRIIIKFISYIFNISVNSLMNNFVLVIMCTLLTLIVSISVSYVINYVLSLRNNSRLKMRECL